MKKVHLVSAAMLIPAVVFADVNIHLSIGSTHSACEYEVEADYVSDGDPWFEECEVSGPSRVSFEYQWSIHGVGHVLRYRKVTFHTVSNAWSFGPWLVKVNYCHPTCRLHHNHVFYRRATHPNWHRAFDSRKKVYVYEYRNPHNSHHKQNTIYRHEYKPVYKKQHVNHNQNQYDKKQHNNQGRYIQKSQRPEDHRKHDKRSEGQSGKLQKKSNVIKKSQKKPHVEGNNHHNNRSDVKKNTNSKKIVLVSARGR